MILSHADFFDIKKLPGVKNMVIILYKHYMEIWTVTEKTSTLLNHNMLQSDYTAGYMEVIDRGHIILMYEHLSGELQAKTQLCLKEFNIVSETLMPDGFEWDCRLVCPFSSNSVIAVSSHYERMGNKEETYAIHSFVKNKQYTITAKLC